MSYKIDYCGIYIIENLINGKVYIGQSKHIKARWKAHFSKLKKGIHENDYLQKSWNKYGGNNFKHTIIELCEEDDLNVKERYYIALYNATNKNYGYNMTIGGDNANALVSDLAKEKQRIALSGERSSQHKEVICLETKEIFPTIKEASLNVNVHYSAITNCCMHKSNTCKNMHWMFLDEYNSSSSDYINQLLNIKPPKREKQIIYLNTGKVFNSIKEASEQLNINVNSISQCCSGRRPTAGKDANGEKRIFMYYEDYQAKALA